MKCHPFPCLFPLPPLMYKKIILTLFFYSDASMNADDMAGQSVRLKEEHLRKEEEKVNFLST